MQYFRVICLVLAATFLPIGQAAPTFEAVGSDGVSGAITGPTAESTSVGESTPMMGESTPLTGESVPMMGESISKSTPMMEGGVMASAPISEMPPMIGSEQVAGLDNLMYVNGFAYQGQMVLDQGFMTDLAQRMGVSFGTMGTLISDLTRLQMGTDLMVGCNRISQQRKVKVILIVQIARACHRRMMLRNMKKNVHIVIILRTIGNGMMMRKKQTTRTTKIIVVLVPVVVVRVQKIVQVIGVSQTAGTQCIQRILRNMGSWGYGQRAVSSSSLHARDDAVNVNSTDMQMDATEMVMGMLDQVGTLANATDEQTMDWSNSFADKMNTSQPIISNIASELLDTMMDSNVTTGAAFDAIGNVAMAKKDPVIAEPMTDAEAAVSNGPSIPEASKSNQKVAQVPAVVTTTTTLTPEKSLGMEQKVSMSTETKRMKENLMEGAMSSPAIVMSTQEPMEGMAGMSVNKGDAMVSSTMMAASPMNLKSGSIQLAAASAFSALFVLLL
ncbi:hypothetical protein BC830DRAFT_1112804 [Chytriomyces sp. MP71]|nr:hypothetical protein BC830DRAFT_1112804 [Chytriomyces sp. MP71]